MTEDLVEDVADVMAEAEEEGHSFLPRPALEAEVGRRLSRLEVRQLRDRGFATGPGGELYRLTTWQQEQALAAGLRTLATAGRLAVITGGPGTGKTTQIREMIQSAPHVTLCAPSGKAARRLAEATGHDAVTVHMTLYRAENQQRRLGGLVVVDEASMLSLEVAAWLVGALDPGARLVLVGDVDQLAAVGPGQVLRDIIAANVCKVTRLTRLWRAAADSPLARQARLLRGGHMLDLQPAEGWRFVAAAEGNIVEAAVQQALAAGPAVQVLAPTRRVARTINARLQAAWNPRAAGKGEVLVDREIVRAGDLVVINRNDYSRNVRNGEVGKVLDAGPGGVTVEVEGWPIFWPAEELPAAADQHGRPALSLAYCMTVAKSQGSEFDHVIIALPATRANSVNLVYTALTRARQSCTLVSSEPVVAEAVHTRQRRFSRLATLLRAGAA